MKISTCAFVFGGALLAASSLYADSTWTGAAGDNDLANAANWSAGIPTSDNAIFNAPIGSLTLAENLTLCNGKDVKFGGTGAINLDLGADRTLTVANRTFVNSGAVVTLKSGTYSNESQRFFVGDNVSDATMIVDGPNAKLIGCTSQYIEVGSANTVSGSKDNLLKVQNGGSVDGYIIMGRLAVDVARKFCGTNTLWVTGEGSTLVTRGGNLIVGGQQGMSHFILDDKATATVNGHITLGKWQEGNGSRRVGGMNQARITDGATLKVTDSVIVGQHGPSNLFEVVNGKLEVAGALHTSYEHETNLSEYVRPHANTFRLSGTNTSFILNGELRVGRATDASDDALEVLDGASMTLYNSSSACMIGEERNSHGNRVLVDGGSLNFWNRQVFIGRYGDGNILTVTNGGVVTAGNFVHVGCGGAAQQGGASNTFEVAAGGTCNMKGQFRLGWGNRADGTKPGGNKLWIHGKDAKFFNANDFRFDRFDGQIGNRLIVEDGGYFESKNPVQLPYTQTAGGFSSNLQIRVTGEGSRFLMLTNEFVLGYNYIAASTNVDASVYVAEGGKMEIRNANLIIGNGNGTVGGGTLCENNALWIGPGGEFEQSFLAYKNGNTVVSPIVHVGNNYNAAKNLVKVEGLATWKNVGVDRADLFSVGYGGASNRLEVVNGGQAVLSRVGLIVGSGAGAVDCGVLVGADSALTVTNTEFAAIGMHGTGASLVVDGGTLDMFGASRLVTGAAMAASNSIFVVKNGGVANLTRLVLGDKAPNSTATIDNATMNLINHDNISSAGYLDIGYSFVAAGVNPSHATLTIAGRNAKVNVGYNIRMRNPTAQIRFIVPAEGFAETPFFCQSGFETVAAGASIHVSADPAWPSGSKATLLKTVNMGHIAELTLTCDEGLRIRRVGNSIVARKPGGGVFILR